MRRDGVRTVELCEEYQLYVRQHVMLDGYDCLLSFELTLGFYSSPEMLFVSPQDVQLSWMPAQRLPLPPLFSFRRFPLQLSAVLLCLLPQILQNFFSSHVSQSQS